MENFVNNLYNVLFLSQEIHAENQIYIEFEELHEILFDLIKNTSEDEVFAEKQADHFFYVLPELYNSLILDAESILEFDPATESLEEILLSYPGFLRRMYIEFPTSSGFKR